MAKKQDIVERIVEKSGFTKKNAGIALDTTIEAIEELVLEGEKVVLQGFMTLEVADVKAQIRVNPRTGEKYQAESSKTVKAKVSKSLKDKAKAGL